MINFIRKLQVKFILTLWGKLPFLTLIRVYHTDHIITQRHWWIKSNITKFHDKQEAYITTNKDLLFITKGIIVIPTLHYSQNEAYPMRW